MTAISGASAFAPQQLPPLDPPQVPTQDTQGPDVLVNNGATDCFPDDMAERLQAGESGPDIAAAGQEAGGHAAGIIGDCTPMPEGWPTLEGEATVRDELYLDDQGQIGTRKVVDAGEGDDSVQVTRHADGSATVTVNGERTELTPEEARNMRITGGEGDDTITVVDNRDPITQLQDELSGDEVHVQGGDGADRFEGQVEGTTLDNSPLEGDTVNGKYFP